MKAWKAARQYLRVLEFDVKTEQWTGRHWKYVLKPTTTRLATST